MKLIGVMDSPYVRRVAVVLAVMEVPFEHIALSVLSTFKQFQQINPVVRAPTMICDNGEVLMESSLILQYVEATLRPLHRLWPEDPVQLQHEFRRLSLALTAIDKGVQYVYECNMRSLDNQREPWLQRVKGQMLSAFAALERDQAKPRNGIIDMGHAEIATAIAWHFVRAHLPGDLIPSLHPTLAALSDKAEQTPYFRQYAPLGLTLSGEDEEPSLLSGNP